MAAIQNVIQKKYVPIDDVGKRYLFENDFTAGLRFAVVTGHAQTIELEG